MAENGVRPEFLDRAEAAKLDAEALQHQAEAAKATAEARKMEAEALEAEHKARLAQIALEREEHKRRKELVADEYFYRFLLDEAIGDASVKKAIKQLAEWERMAGGNPITVEVVIDSPGGSVFDGFHLLDYIRDMQRRGHTVNTTALGMAASMGGVLLQVGDTRRMSSNSMMLIHEAQFMAFGSWGNVVDEVELVRKMHDRILELFATRAKQAKGTRAMTKAQIKRKWHRKDWWLTAQEAERYGFVDEVI